jgi:HKD family nuclease
MVSSANPHDASSYHSNIAFHFRGEAVRYLLESEQAVAAFSGTEITGVEYQYDPTLVRLNTQVRILTEDKIKEQLLEKIRETGQGDEIDLAMFYLSHQEVIKELILASGRGVQVRVVLDPSKDAFGYEKSGIPNRQAAATLIKKSDGKIQLRWYMTNGEQFHSKLIGIYHEDQLTLIGGSANYTRRNLDNYNLESDVMVTVSENDPLAQAFKSFYNRIWENQNGIYTGDYSEYQDDSRWKALLYKFQEKTGLGTF